MIYTYKYNHERLIKKLFPLIYLIPSLEIETELRVKAPLENSLILEYLNKRRVPVNGHCVS